MSDSDMIFDMFKEVLNEASTTKKELLESILKLKDVQVFVNANDKDKFAYLIKGDLNSDVLKTMISINYHVHEVSLLELKEMFLKGTIKVVKINPKKVDPLGYQGYKYGVINDVILEEYSNNLLKNVKYQIILDVKQIPITEAKLPFNI